jgi:hypothetical protein
MIVVTGAARFAAITGIVADPVTIVSDVNTQSPTQGRAFADENRSPAPPPVAVSWRAYTPRHHQQGSARHAAAPYRRPAADPKDAPVTQLPESPLFALPDGNAELHLVLRLSWSDVAELGREAGRLAAHLQRTVSLDEAVSHKLSAQPDSTAPAQVRAEPPKQPSGSGIGTMPLQQTHQATELTRMPTASSAALEAGHPPTARHGSAGPLVSRLADTATESSQPGGQVLSTG